MFGDVGSSEDAGSYEFLEEDDEWSRKRKSKNRSKRKKLMLEEGIDEKNRVNNFTNDI